MNWILCSFKTQQGKKKNMSSSCSCFLLRWKQDSFIDGNIPLLTNSQKENKHVQRKVLFSDKSILKDHTWQNAAVLEEALAHVVVKRIICWWQRGFECMFRTRRWRRSWRFPRRRWRRSRRPRRPWSWSRWWYINEISFQHSDDINFFFKVVVVAVDDVVNVQKKTVPNNGYL